jgi:hypothetical protein
LFLLEQTTLASLDAITVEALMETSARTYTKIYQTIAHPCPITRKTLYVETSFEGEMYNVDVSSSPPR